MDLILAHRLVAILRLDPLDNVEQLVDVLLDAGVRCLELTLTNPQAPMWVERLMHSNPRFRLGEACLGIGSVRTADEAKRAMDAGAQFVVTPIVAIGAIRACADRGVPIAAGAYTPTEIAMAWDAGASVVKVFPARSLGPGFIRDVLAPMPHLKLMPTGGIDATNAAEYLRAGAVAVGIGGQLCPQALVDRREWDTIRSAAQRIVAACAT